MVGSDLTPGGLLRPKADGGLLRVKDLLKKWEDVRTVLEWHPNHVEVNRVGDLYIDNAMNLQTPHFIWFFNKYTY
jgi:hypothetical protein